MVEVGNVKELEDAMETMLSEEERRLQMAKKAVKLADELLPDEILKQWQKIIRRHVK